MFGSRKVSTHKIEYRVSGSQHGFSVQESVDGGIWTFISRFFKSKDTAYAALGRHIIKLGELNVPF